MSKIINSHHHSVFTNVLILYLIVPTSIIFISSTKNGLAIIFVSSTLYNNSVVATLSHLLSCNSSHIRHCRNPNHHTSVFFTCQLTTDKFPEITKKDQRQHPKMQPLVCKAFIYGISATFLFSSCHQHYRLHMHSLRELVHGSYTFQFVAAIT